MTIYAETERLRLRNWHEGDRDLFHEINSDPDVMVHFPWRLTRAQSDEKFEIVRQGITDTGFGFYAAEIKHTGDVIGFVGLADANLSQILPQSTKEVGWRLAQRYWGNGFATEAANALLDRGFTEFNLPEIVSFCVQHNERSKAVMRRIGLFEDKDRSFDHPRVPETHPHLVRHDLFAMSKLQWQSRQ